MRRFVTFLAVVVLSLSTAGVALAAENPHCNGNSDNWHLPNHHTDQDGPPCD